MKYGHIINNIVVDICDTDPFTLYHDTLAEKFQLISDDVQIGWEASELDEEGLFQAFAAPEQPELEEPLVDTADFTLTPAQYKQWLGAARRIAIRTLAGSDAMAFDMQDSLEYLSAIWSQHPDFVAALDYLETKATDFPDLANIKTDFYQTGYLAAK